MPKMSGTELVQTYKKRISTPAIFPVVLLTARTAIEQNIEGLQHRCGRLHHQTIQHKPTDFPLQQLGELPHPLTGEIQQTAAGSRPNARYEPD